MLHFNHSEKRSHRTVRSQLSIIRMNLKEFILILPPFDHLIFLVSSIEEKQFLIKF